jgi:hypothetical protein
MPLQHGISTPILCSPCIAAQRLGLFILGDIPPTMTTTKVKQDEHGAIEHDVAVGSTYIPDLNDKAMERRVVRKIDTRILPFICISYLINYLDRVSRIPDIWKKDDTHALQVNLGNARTLNNDVPSSNIVKELGLTGNRYNIAVAVFFVPYVIFEAPSNFAMKYFSPSVWIGRISKCRRFNYG